VFLALELEFTLEAWRFIYECLVPKLKQLCHDTTPNRGSQAIIAVESATIFNLVEMRAEQPVGLFL
jgi:hypothetical protein